MIVDASILDIVHASADLDPALADSLPRHEWAADQRMGYCPRCGSLHHRYGDSAVSPLCRDCRGATTTGAPPAGNPTQPSQG